MSQQSSKLESSLTLL